MGAALENPHAGQGPVVFDIGGDVGALVVEMPRAMLGVEVEIRPRGASGAAAHQHEHGTQHTHTHEHGDGHGHHHPHVAVVDRPTPSGWVPSLVFGELAEGCYELYEKDGGPVELTADVRGGEVTFSTWPGSPG